MRIFTFLTAALFASVAGADQTKWEEFKRRFQRTYATEKEEQHRFGIFMGNLQRAEELNKMSQEANSTATFGVTKFSDLSVEEFKAQYLTKRPTPPPAVVKVVTPTNKAPPSDLDWRTKNVVTKVKDQGVCGSCWAFSATEHIESAWALAGNKLTEFAPQQVVSCDKTDAGCNGGDLPTAFQYVEKAGGLATEASYPYTSGKSGATGSCKTFTVAGGSISDFSYATTPCYNKCDNQDLDALVSAMAANGPPAVCVYAESWQTYTGGILTNAHCRYAYSSLDHCVHLVGVSGYGQAAGKSYFIVRNSWGTNWGIDGYIHLDATANTCGVADEAALVKIK